jgi:hypothetical protein
MHKALMDDAHGVLFEVFPERIGYPPEMTREGFMQALAHAA